MRLLGEKLGLVSVQVALKGLVAQHVFLYPPIYDLLFIGVSSCVVQLGMSYLWCDIGVFILEGSFGVVDTRDKSFPAKLGMCFQGGLCELTIGTTQKTAQRGLYYGLVHSSARWDVDRLAHTT